MTDDQFRRIMSKLDGIAIIQLFHGALIAIGLGLLVSHVFK